MKGWRAIAAGVALYWGWLFIAAAIWSGDHDDPWPAYIPLVVAAAVTLIAGLAAVRDPDRRRERLALWLSVASGALALVGTIWGIAADESGSEWYALPLGLSFLLVPVIAVLAFSGRRFSKSPEKVRAPLSVRFERGWREADSSWTVLRENRGLLVLPSASFVLGTSAWIGAYVLVGTGVDRFMPRMALTGFIVLLPLTMLGTFLGVAFLCALNRRLDGQRASAVDGLRMAWQRRGPVFRWSLVAAGVGAILQALQQLRSEWALAPLVSWLAGLAWGVLTVFVLPVLAVEGVGVRDAAQRATGLVRDKWGEGVAGLGNLSLVGMVAIVPVSLVLGVAAGVTARDPEAREIVFVAGFVAFMLVVSAIHTAGQVLSVALYRHATGRSIGPFTPAVLADAAVRRRRLRG
jgi:uncharacterized protein DUF6159